MHAWFPRKRGLEGSRCFSTLHHIDFFYPLITFFVKVSHPSWSSALVSFYIDHLVQISPTFWGFLKVGNHPTPTPAFFSWNNGELKIYGCNPAWVHGDWQWVSDWLVFLLWVGLVMGVGLCLINSYTGVWDIGEESKHNET